MAIFLLSLGRKRIRRFKFFSDDEFDGICRRASHLAPNMVRRIPIILIVDLLAIIFIVVMYFKTGEADLGESSILTYISGAQILGVAVLSALIFRARTSGSAKKWSLKNPKIIWALIAAGFVFLTADEFFKIHENIDEGIHAMFKLEESGLSDRIDDLIILLYAVVGLIAIAAYRREFVLMKKSKLLFVAGFACLFLMVALDALTNRDDVLANFFQGDGLETALTCFSILEEGAKVVSSGFFILAFQVCLKLAKSEPVGSLAE